MNADINIPIDFRRASRRSKIFFFSVSRAAACSCCSDSEGSLVSPFVVFVRSCFDWLPGVPVCGCGGSATSGAEGVAGLLCGGICFGGDIGIVGLRMDLMMRVAYRSLESRSRYLCSYNLLSIPRAFTKGFQSSGTQTLTARLSFAACFVKIF